MKRNIWVCLLLLMSVLSSAQTQQGYVKTKGRLGNNGSVIAGTRLSGATVTVKGGNAVLSGNNGTFSLSLPNNNSFFLQNVQKQGYVLTDPDVLSKQYVYSKNPLVLVLETPDQQTDDRLAAERKIRKTLQRQLQEREDEIEALKEQNKLSEEEYRKQLQDIYDQQESNEKLISEMAERYSKTDFDLVDDFNRRISDCIINGRLTEADSLLNTKGDINSRAAQLRQHQETNAQVEQEIKIKQKKLKELIKAHKTETYSLIQARNSAEREKNAYKQRIEQDESMNRKLTKRFMNQLKGHQGRFQAAYDFTDEDDIIEFLSWYKLLKRRVSKRTIGSIVRHRLSDDTANLFLRMVAEHNSQFEVEEEDTDA